MIGVFEDKKCEVKVFFFVTMAALLVSMMLIPAGNATVGVKAGDWAKYGNISASWSSNETGATEPSYITELKNTAWFTLTVQSVTNNTVTVQETGQYKNGTAVPTGTLSGDIETGYGTIGFFIIPANLGKGDIVSLGYLLGSYSINDTVTYSRTNRPANLVQHYLLIPGYMTADLSFYWDKATGILCELSISVSLSIENYTESSSEQMFLIDKSDNLWSGAIAPPGAGGLGDIFGQWLSLIHI